MAKRDEPFMRYCQTCNRPIYYINHRWTHSKTQDDTTGQIAGHMPNKGKDDVGPRGD